MKKLIRIAMVILFYSPLSSAAGIKNYSELPKATRAQTEAALKNFLPKLNQASLAVLQDIFISSSRPLMPNDQIAKIPLKGEMTVEKIFRQHQSEAGKEVNLAQRSTLSLAELMSVTTAGLNLQEILDNAKSRTPDEYLKALSSHLKINDQTATYTTLSIDSMGFPYCVIELEVSKAGVQFTENCD
jgi:hypothetical protein